MAYKVMVSITVNNPYDPDLLEGEYDGVLYEKEIDAIGAAAMASNEYDIKNVWIEEV